MLEGRVSKWFCLFLFLHHFKFESCKIKPSLLPFSYSQKNNFAIAVKYEWQHKIIYLELSPLVVGEVLGTE